MTPQRFFHLLLVVGTALSVMGILLFFQQGSLPLMDSTYGLIAQSNTNNYLGPHAPIPGNPQMIRIQILVNDDPNPKGVQIESVNFNRVNIPLKPRDIYGYRGQGSFQLPPGKYKLRWTVSQDRIIWPRTLSHEEEVDLDPRDLWIQINIIGENAAIS